MGAKKIKTKARSDCEHNNWKILIRYVQTGKICHSKQEGWFRPTIVLKGVHDRVFLLGVLTATKVLLGEREVGPF